MLTELKQKAFLFSFALMLIFTCCGFDTIIRLNEGVAVGRMKSIRTAQETYRKTTGAGKYGTMNDLITTNLITNEVNSGGSIGYKFDLKITEEGYEVYAVPTRYGEKGTGIFSYYLDQSGIIRGANRNGDPADKNDPQVGEKSD